MVTRLVQPVNSPWEMVLTVAGRLTEVMRVQPLKTASPSETTLLFSSKITLDSRSQFSNTEAPTVSSSPRALPPEKVTAVSPVQPEKAPSSMVVTKLGMVSELSLVQPAKAPAAMVRMPVGMRRAPRRPGGQYRMVSPALLVSIPLTEP